MIYYPIYSDEMHEHFIILYYIYTIYYILCKLLCSTKSTVTNFEKAKKLLEFFILRFGAICEELTMIYNDYAINI